MNNLIKTVFRVPQTLKAVATPMASTFGKREFTRTLWHMSSNKFEDKPGSSQLLQLHKPSLNCSCGCGAKFIHTKGERELVEFLTEEIVAERKATKVKAIPKEVEGFQVKTTGAEVELTKSNDKEKIVISFNVNHTVDADEEAEIDPNMDKPNMAEMKSTPQFEVDIIKDGGKTLSFTCSFLNDQEDDTEGFNDLFGIDEVTYYEGEWSDKNYAVAGDVLDGYMYDLLMNLLEEKGISNEFVEKLSNFSTIYEHSQYVNLLEAVSKFTVGK